ncbi:homeobox protein 4-like [Pectinophora gossypiella]|uniref:homeobox protein 4-like n=1 Tax=Pectinophora gossypiella TaxID=13191 RepID=UPI00214EEF81|nr:homeobox protein 4-like [Pectinophora gossypiella]
MPYYCTVPRCTSMAGKAKNVSFHQFPRDEELARLWNKILKRGKPYTKYSKVCSLHFRPEDYTITSVGKNKGQWRTLRKDAIPSQNLPSELPAPTTHRTRNSVTWMPNNLPTNVIDPRMQHQMAQAIYMQTMLAMQAATNGTQNFPTQGPNDTKPTDLTTSHPTNFSITDIERLLQKHANRNGIERLQENQKDLDPHNTNTSYKCQECSKCFKDPDVFVLHRRTHSKNPEIQERLPDSLPEKENFNANSDIANQDTLRANPILANLLKSGIAPSNDTPDGVNSFNAIFDANNILSIENQIMTALAANMESYIRNLSSMFTQAKSPEETSDYNDNEDNSTENENVDGESSSNDNFAKTDNDSTSYSHNFQKEYENFKNDRQNSEIDESYAVKDPQESDTHNFEEAVRNFESKSPYVEKDSSNFENSPSSPEKDPQTFESGPKSLEDGNIPQNFEQDVQNMAQECQNLTNQGSENGSSEPNCDKEDLNDSRDSSNLVIDENL